MTNPSVPSGPSDLPKMPTQVDAPSASELMPFRSGKISVVKSSVLIPLVVTAATVAALFVVLSSISKETPFSETYQRYIDVLALYILFVLIWAVHAYSGIRTHIWIYLPAALLAGLFLITPLWTLLYLFTDDILPGYLAKSSNVLVQYVGLFFALTREEIVKALPGLIGLVVFFRMAKKPGGAEAQTGLGRWFFTSSPLEGLMLGVAAGVGFTYQETMFQYVPENVDDVAKRAGELGGDLFGVLLLLPRILGGVVGHLAYGGISGYFIGLGARYPKRVWVLVLTGILVATVPHALWDLSLGNDKVVNGVKITVVGLATVILFLLCLMKAKQMYATEHGGVSTDSILVGAASGGPAAAAQPYAYAPPPQAVAPAPQPVPQSYTPATASPPPAVTPAAPIPPAFPTGQTLAPPAAATAARPAALFALVCGSEQCNLAVGQTVDLAAAFPSLGLPSPSRAEVSAHPKDPTIVGLRNLTEATWAIEVEAGATASVPPGRNVKLVAGEKITIGVATFAVRKV